MPPVLFALVVGAIILVGALFALVGPIGIMALIMLVIVIKEWIGNGRRKSSLKRKKG